MKPELRIYNQPYTITSEADIKTTLYSDKFLVMNLVKGNEYFNIRYQIKPFMVWIWISTLLIALGGLAVYLKKIMKNKILLSLAIFFLIFCFIVLFKSLDNSNIYVPDSISEKPLINFNSQDLFSNKKFHLIKYLQIVNFIS